MRALAVACQIFLVPGAFAPGSDGVARFVTSGEYFSEYRYFFESKGCSVRTGELPPDGSIEERSLVLRDQVDRFVREKGAPVWIVAHSQGGLDARFALKSGGLRKVEAMVTVGTPHRGTPLADWVVDHRERGSWLYWGLKWLLDYDLLALRFAGELRASFLKQHESHFAAVPAVRYASARAVCRSHCSGLLRALARWASVGEGDGLVPGASQGFGEDLGEYDLDHVGEIGVDEAGRAERARLLARLWSFFEAHP